MLRIYRICSTTMKFSKDKFYNKLLGGVIFLKVKSDIT